MPMAFKVGDIIRRNEKCQLHPCSICDNYLDKPCTIIRIESNPYNRYVVARYKDNFMCVHSVEYIKLFNEETDYASGF